MVILGTDTIGIFFGHGDGSFQSVRTYPIKNGSSVNGIAVHDFNNDGQLDIVVAHFGIGSMGILLGYRNGTFFNEITYDIGSNSKPYYVAVSDLNKDGRTDVIIPNLESDNIAVFFGSFSEAFLGLSPYSIGDSTQPVSIAVGDFNNDAHLDAVVADRGTNKVIILYGSSDGTFSSEDHYSTGDGTYPCWIAVDDFDQDHRLDIVVVHCGTNSIGILLGYGNGTFSSVTMYSTGNSSLPLSLAVGHFNNDTHLDIAVANYGTNNIALLLGYGNGTFESPLFFPTGYNSQPIAVAFGDLNQDKLVDVVICNNGYNTIEIFSKNC